MARRRVILAALVLAAGCTRDATSAQVPTTVSPPTVTPTTRSPAAPPTTALPATTAPATTVAPTTAPPTPAPPTTAPPTTTPPPVTTAPADDGVSYVVPVVDVAAAGWSADHAGYPATDIFLPCGATIVSPVDGTVSEVRRVDEWRAEVDDPATRGGKTVAIVGDDGVRYYLAHFDSIRDGLEPGVRVAAGDEVGLLGTTGRTSACHVHMGISPPCPNPEWWVRRGVVWPYPYLDAWRAGEQRSPAAEIAQWLADNPTACATPP